VHRTGAGTAATSALVQRIAGGDSGLARLPAASTTTVARASPAMILLRLENAAPSVASRMGCRKGAGLWGGNIVGRFGILDRMITSTPTA